MPAKQVFLKFLSENTNNCENGVGNKKVIRLDLLGQSLLDVNELGLNSSATPILALIHMSDINRYSYIVKQTHKPLSVTKSIVIHIISSTHVYIDQKTLQIQTTQ